MGKMWFDDKKRPYICTPLTGRTIDDLLSELQSIVLKKPDMIEWRADFYENITQMDQVLAAAQAIRSASNGIPILFTIRSEQEGGQSISLSEAEKIEVISSICSSDCIDLIDYELSNEPSHIHHLRKVSTEQEKGLVLSYHNFDCTPEKSVILKQLLLAEFYGADLAKVSVMPLADQDVLTLLEVTREARDLLSIPILTISMGGLGVLSRVMGWMYGSVMTFAVGENSSAPGQVPIEDLRLMIEKSKQFMGVK